MLSTWDIFIQKVNIGIIPAIHASLFVQGSILKNIHSNKCFIKSIQEIFFCYLRKQINPPLVHRPFPISGNFI